MEVLPMSAGTWLARSLRVRPSNWTQGLCLSLCVNDTSPERKVCKGLSAGNCELCPLFPHRPLGETESAGNAEGVFKDSNHCHSEQSTREATLWGGGLRTKTLLQETSQCQKTRSKSLCLRFTHFILTSTMAMPTLQKRKPKTERNPQITGRGGRARTRPDQPFRIPDRDWAFLSGLRNAVASAASGARRSLDYPRETGQTSRRNMLLSPLVGVEGRETEALTG